MPTQTAGGMATEYSIEVRRRDGVLFYQEESVKLPELPPVPDPPYCYTEACINKFKFLIDEWATEVKRRADLYRWIHAYHTARSGYCMAHKNDEIDEKYRTGIPAPTTIEEIKAELKKFNRR